MNDTRPVQRRLAAVMVADVAGFSRLMERDESLTFARLRRLRSEVSYPKVEEFGGRIIKTTGDGFLAEFGSATNAVRCGIEIQQAVMRLEAGQGEQDRIRLRIGINVGDVIQDGEDIAGDGVNIAARLEGLAPVDGVCISSSVREQLREDLGIAIDDLGERQLKNIERPIRVYSLNLGSAPAPVVVLEQKPTAARPPRLSIVVLPFANASGDPAQDYFSESITDEVTSQLSKIRGSYVIAHDTAKAYRGRQVDIKVLGIELGVRYVLRGSVERLESGIDTSVQLMDTLSGTIVWADTIEVDSAGVRNIRREVVNRLAIALNLQLVNVEAKRSAAEDGANLDAIDLVMQGWVAYGGNMSRQQSQHAETLFDRALAIDPNCQQALVGRAMVVFAQAFAYPGPDRAELIARAEIDALRAIALDDMDAAAHFALSRVRLGQCQPEAALAECENALALDGNMVRARAWLSYVLNCMDQHERALVAIDEALAQSPRDPFRNVWLFWKGLTLQAMGRPADAAFWLSKSTFWAAFATLAVVYHWMGEREKAQAALKQLQAQMPAITANFIRLYVFSNYPGHVKHFENVRQALLELGLPDNPPI